MITVIGVHKKWSKETPSGRHPRAKKHWCLYFLDENFKFHTKRISRLQVPYYKKQKVSRLKFVCNICGCKFLSIGKDRKFSPCPNGCDD